LSAKGAISGREQVRPNTISARRRFWEFWVLETLLKDYMITLFSPYFSSSFVYNIYLAIKNKGFGN